MLAERLGADDVTAAPDHPSPQGARASQPGPTGDTSNSGALGADAAHELANLVMVVSGSLAQLRRQPLDEQGQRQLARAEWGIRQAAQLTRRVLSQAQGGDDKAETVDLNAAVGKFAAVIGQHVEDHVQVVAELAPRRVPVRLDAGLLELVLLNLVRNAADAMPYGGKVVLRTKGPRLDGLGDQLAVEVSVSDNSTGMPLAVAQRAMDALSTSKPLGKDAEPGLWMAQRFASDCGGKASIETATGQGTTVRLSLPYAGDAKQG